MKKVLPYGTDGRLLLRWDDTSSSTPEESTPIGATAVNVMVLLPAVCLSVDAVRAASTLLPLLTYVQLRFCSLIGPATASAMPTKPVADWFASADAGVT